MKGGKLSLVLVAVLALGGTGTATLLVAERDEHAEAEAPASPTRPPFDRSELLVRPAPREEPVPVLLVPGWFDTARELAALRIRLASAGWPDEHVATLTFEDPVGSNREHAREIAAAVDELVERTGVEEIDIVAHSMGGLAARWYLMRRPDAPVRRVVFIASPHRGTLSAHLAWGGGRGEMMPESPFLDTLNAAAETPAGVEAITIRTSVDTHILPGQSATLPGVEDHLLCCPTHAGLLHDEQVFKIVRDFLEDGTGR